MRKSIAKFYEFPCRCESAQSSLVRTELCLQFLGFPCPIFPVCRLNNARESYAGNNRVQFVNIIDDDSLWNWKFVLMCKLTEERFIKKMFECFISGQQETVI